MWTITQLKERGRICFHRNYWRAVLVALVITVCGGMQGANVVSFIYSAAFRVTVNITKSTSKLFSDSIGSGFEGPRTRAFENDLGGSPFDDPSDIFGEDDFGGGFNFSVPENGMDNSSGSIDLDDLFPGIGNYAGEAIALAFVFVAIISTVIFVVLILCILAQIFLLNPLFVGTQRFFVHNLNADGQIGDLGFGYDRNYRNHVKIMFYRMLYTFGWSLLFVIPGIYKSYEYRMVPYLLAEYPNMDKEQAFYTSKYMMQNEKWKSFLLDLSFIGWFLLSFISCGIVGVFFTNPYYASTCAVQYEALKAIKGMPEYNRPDPNFPPVYPNQPVDEADEEDIIPSSDTSEPETEDIIYPETSQNEEMEDITYPETSQHQETEDITYPEASQRPETGEDMFVSDDGDTV